MTCFVHAPDSPLAALTASLDRIARSRAPALVVGERGAGKKTLARHLHALGPWAARPFVVVSCGMPAHQLATELFGDGARAGRFVEASGGTLYLDDVTAAPLDLQIGLVRALQEKMVVPVGTSRPVPIDTRVVAGTSADVGIAVRRGILREDLFFRLDVIRLAVPPLRQRPMDIAPLARALAPNISDEAIAALLTHDWPGNVRELAEVVHGATPTVASITTRLPKAAVKPASVGSAPLDGFTMTLPEHGLDLKRTLETLEKDLIRAALLRAEGNRARAASLLGMNRTTLVEKLRRWPLSA